VLSIFDGISSKVSGDTSLYGSLWTATFCSSHRYLTMAVCPKLAAVNAMNRKVRRLLILVSDMRVSSSSRRCRALTSPPSPSLSIYLALCQGGAAMALPMIVWV